MTQRLKELFEKASALPEDQQDQLANRWIAEMQDDAEWDRSFANTPDKKFAAMAARVRADVASGK